MKTLGLALGAGGSRGVAHIGVLKAFEEEGLWPDYVCGASMGSVVGAACAVGLTTDEMWAAVEKLRLLDIIAPARQRGGLFGTRKMRALLAKYLGEVEFKDLKIPFHCVAVDMISQELVEFSEGNVVDAVVCSSSIPAVFHPTLKDGMRLIDGGVLERVPARQVKKMGADVVVAVDVLGQRTCKADCPNALGILLETLDVMDNARTLQRRQENKKIIDFWMEPDLGDASQYDLKIARLAYEKGYEIGKAYAPKIEKLLKK